MGCGAIRAKSELTRLAVAGDRVVADPRAALPGRGAYVCSAACAGEAMRRSALAHAFRRAVSADPDLLQSLR